MTTNDVSLRDYLEALIKGVIARLDAHAELNNQQFNQSQTAIKKSEENLTTRLDHLNEWRNQNKDERADLATKDSVTNLTKYFSGTLLSVQKSLDEKLVDMQKSTDARLKLLENANSFASGKAWMIMAIFAGIPTIIAIVALIRG